jgi:hypothetical protein
MILGYCGPGVKIVKALRKFACEYADRTEADYRVFMAAVKRGRFPIADDIA